ncbi:Vacuolar protein sorting-associated protein Ist1 [Arabidopsis suecica]|uniref:Vacuolar protein sorting-associated protein Ist1 n=1 Tax=Arabidopsis suecica TaxID=45249 RepID=A0A8T2CFR3_ARASU|nr:Vacuolar protein sorting-associated protein Ist1 [Arabidopsis suecica]
MSMLDSFFNKGFKAAKCKTLLKLTIPRIKLIRNRREAQIKQMRREIAKLLETGQEATARIRVEHIIREEKMMAAQEILELFCELIAVRLPIIEAQRECPLDLKEAISSVCFAAPRCSDLTELQQVQILFVSKYGKEFVAAASELKPDSGVNRKLVELLSVRAPSPEIKLKLLKEIAEEHELDWDPASTETDLFKSHEDLLDGPKQFGGGSKLPLPEEQNEGTHEKEKSDSDSEYDILDFPEVPNVLLRPTPGATPVNAPDAAKSASYEHTSHDLPFDSEKAGVEKTASKRDDHPAKANKTVVEGQQSSPIVMESFERKNYSPPSIDAVGPFPTKESGASRDAPRKISDGDLQDVLTAAQAAADSAERAAAAARSAASLAQLRINELTRKTSDQSPESPSENPFHAPSMGNLQFDHQNSSGSSSGDLTELQRAETSSLFNSEKNNQEPQRHSSMEKPQFDRQNSSFSSYGDLTPQRFPSMEKPQFDHQNSSASNYDDLTPQRFLSMEKPQFDHQNSSASNYDDLTPQRFPSFEKPQFDHQNSSVSSFGDLPELQRPETSSLDRLSPDQDHQQMRLPSMEDDPYYSYPNLFTSQKPDRSSGSHSFSDNTRPAHDS